MRFGLELDENRGSPVRSKHRLWRWVATPSTRPRSRGGRSTPLAPLASRREPRESGRLFLGVSRPVGPAQAQSTDPRRPTEARSRERHIGPPQIGRHRGRTPPNLGASAHIWSPDAHAAPSRRSQRRSSHSPAHALPANQAGPPGLSATAALPDPREIASIAYIAIEANSPPCSQRMVRICRGGRV